MFLFFLQRTQLQRNAICKMLLFEIITDLVFHVGFTNMLCTCGSVGKLMIREDLYITYLLFVSASTNTLWLLLLFLASKKLLLPTLNCIPERIR